MVAGNGPICTDLQMLPRRGPARGSAAGVYAGRRRDVVRAADTVFGVIEPLMKQVFAVIGRDVTTPFPQMPYAGCDREVWFRQTGSALWHADSGPARVFPRVTVSVFREIVANGGTVRGFVVRNAGGYSRSEVDGIVDQAKTLGATGLVWARRLEDGAVTSSIMKAMGEEAV